MHQLANLKTVSLFSLGQTKRSFDTSRQHVRVAGPVGTISNLSRTFQEKKSGRDSHFCQVAANTAELPTHSANEITITEEFSEVPAADKKLGQVFLSTLKGFRYAFSFIIPVSLLLGVWGVSYGPLAIANFLAASSNLQVRVQAGFS